MSRSDLDEDNDSLDSTADTSGAPWNPLDELEFDENFVPDEDSRKYGGIILGGDLTNSEKREILERFISSCPSDSLNSSKPDGESASGSSQQNIPSVGKFLEQPAIEVKTDLDTEKNECAAAESDETKIESGNEEKSKEKAEGAAKAYCEHIYDFPQLISV